MRDIVLQFEASVNQSVVGQQSVVRQVLIALLADGHVLLESLPGLAKTRTVKAIATRLAATMSRIQFTPDLLPSDITGAETLLQSGTGHTLSFQPGPIFGNLILADEINRAPAKVQSALLEAMEERQISVAGKTHRMSALFLVMATQNPIEQEGTYPLPEAQMDRFLLKVLIGYPSPESEVAMLRLLREESSAPAEAPAVLSQEVIFAVREEIGQIVVAPAIDDYIVSIVNATRHGAQLDAELGKWIEVGASPRGAIGLDRASRVHAWLQARSFVTPDDVRAVIHPVLRHRLILSYDANADSISADQVIDRLIEKVAVPA
ncbi:AAA domain family protein [Paraburkholderia xenovorans LB400]|jgi:MoxR-like ATPase|uniref:MoxR-like ATPase, putative transcriptional regulator, C1 metabolism n=1 Tax=Paraburkholderia xenovorans (strain LB400) TaxID=266265 RepID=Q13YK6_PARXL|nr:MoxR family ATPase [Paraburkholderia xenovorans]ABE30833.1 MoxR-like ATPase, putative transcriptional regulator, C1 metabolism [Paraburkholderia xenovorans LB400]AIP31764.1 AAA domain family protein [Paraburkholderia xenovorans LB400]NPT39403.1 AAA domain-containing protein [Paraburkholderia xenovorans]